MAWTYTDKSLDGFFCTQYCGQVAAYPGEELFVREGEYEPPPMHTIPDAEVPGGQTDCDTCGWEFSAGAATETETADFLAAGTEPNSGEGKIVIGGGKIAFGSMDGRILEERPFMVDGQVLGRTTIWEEG